MSGAELRANLWLSEFITPWDVYQHGVVEVLAAHKTPYQDMLIVETGMYGKALVLDGKWQSSVGDEFLYHEPLVHPAMVMHGSPHSALILGGGEGATLREVLRWKSVKRAVMVDIDREVVEACMEHLPEMHQGAFDDPRAELIIGDALDYLDTTHETWDVVISDLSDPIEDGPSFKLFTKQYFEKIHRVLAPDGFFVIQAGSLSPPELDMHARLANTVAAVFPNVRSYGSHVPTYSTPWGYCLASERPFDHRPDPDSIDVMLAERTTGGLRFLDGETLLGILQTPAHIRRAIEQETRIYTLDQPPKFFGTGIGAEVTTEA